LGFGAANVVVAVPQAWIDVETMADLDDVASDFRGRYGRWLRVATKYITLTRGFFADHGLGDYRIVESSGATEAAPASGAADVIVDITSSGTTLKANGLKVLRDGVMLKSQANLIASLNANWGAVQKAALTSILRRVDGEMQARSHVALRIAGLDIARVDLAAFGAGLPFGAADGSVTVHCPKKTAPALVDLLMEYGAETITQHEVEDLFLAENALLDAVLPKL
jgi:ATP phosphoribosyltransferase